MLVQELEVLVKHHYLCLGDDDKVAEVLGPLDLLHVRALGQSEFLKRFLGGEIIQENRVVSTDENLSKRSWIDHINLIEPFLVQLYLFDIGAIQIAHRQLTIHIKDANFVLRNEDCAHSVITTLLKTAINVLNVLVELVDDKARILAIEVEDNVV